MSRAQGRARRLRSAGILLAAGVGAVGAVAAGALPARAAAPAVTVSSPTSGAVFSDTDTPQISGTVSATGTGGTITGDLVVTVTSAAGHPGWSTTVRHWCGQRSCAYTLTSGALTYNGQYTVVVNAAESDPPTGTGQATTGSSSFSVNVPPAAPAGVTAAPAADGSSVTLSWTPNSEPDLVGYRVDRSPSGSGFPLATTSASIVDSAVTPGATYSYTVTAVRSGAASGSTLSSPASGATASVPVPATDAAPPGSSSSPSTGGSSGSGGAAGSTTPSGSGSGVGTGASAPSGGSSVATYGKAAPAPAPTGSLADFRSLMTRNGAASGPEALPAPAVPDLPPADGVEPGSDNPAVAPFSSGSGGLTPAAAGRMTVTYAATTTTDHHAVVRDFGAVALAALLLAVVGHLLWLRRQVEAVT